MLAYLVHIEGVDFANTLFDTEDLSTIRGASQAYLHMPKRISALLREQNPDWEVADIVAGAASVGIFRVTTPEGSGPSEVEAAIARAVATPAQDKNRQDAARPHLSFTWAAVKESGDYGRDHYSLIARARARQLQRLTVDVPDKAPATRPCHFDRKRPATVPVTVGSTDRCASASVKARHDYGVNERHSFYAGELCWSESNLDSATFAVTQSLQDIVDPRRKELDETDRVRLPLALSSKIAVVYFDGNKFTAIREATVFGSEVGKREARHKKFDTFVKTRRRDLLTKIIERLSRDRRHNWVERDGDRRLRFETLLWGGDEALFVLPAWTIFDVLPVLMEALDGWVWKGGYTLSHAVGIAICNLKTPIAVSRELAEAIANAAKADEDVVGVDYQNLANVVSLHVFESVEPPRGDVGDFRLRLYGTSAARAFTLKGREEVAAVLGLIRRLQRDKDGLPRSQLFGLIAEARDKGLLTSDKAVEAGAFIADDGPVATALDRAGSRVKAGDLRTEVLGYSAQAALVPLIRLAELWDYVDPFGTAAAGEPGA